MSGSTVAVDLAKTVFEIAVADDSSRIVQQKRLSRNQFQRFIEKQPASCERYRRLYNGQIPQNNLDARTPVEVLKAIEKERGQILT